MYRTLYCLLGKITTCRRKHFVWTEWWKLHRSCILNKRAYSFLLSLWKRKKFNVRYVIKAVLKENNLNSDLKHLRHIKTSFISLRTNIEIVVFKNAGFFRPRRIFNWRNLYTKKMIVFYAFMSSKVMLSASVFYDIIYVWCPVSDLNLQYMFLKMTCT